MRIRSAVLALGALLAASFPVTARAAGPLNVVTNDGKSYPAKCAFMARNETVLSTAASHE